MEDGDLKQMLVTQNDLVYLDSVNCIFFCINVAVEQYKLPGKFESRWITRSKIKLFPKFRKSGIFQDFQKRLIFS